MPKLSSLLIEQGRKKKAIKCIKVRLSVFAYILHFDKAYHQYYVRFFFNTYIYLCFINFIFFPVAVKLLTDSTAFKIMKGTRNIIK